MASKLAASRPANIGSARIRSASPGRIGPSTWLHSHGNDNHAERLTNVKPPADEWQMRDTHRAARSLFRARCADCLMFVNLAAARSP
jgi:hypothetical protein